MERLSRLVEFEKKTGKVELEVRTGREGGGGGEEGNTARRRETALSPPCDHSHMNYLDSDSLVLNTKHLINT